MGVRRNGIRQPIDGQAIDSVRIWLSGALDDLLQVFDLAEHKMLIIGGLTGCSMQCTR